MVYLAKIHFQKSSRNRKKIPYYTLCKQHRIIRVHEFYKNLHQKNSFFVVEIQGLFEFEENWYRRNERIRSKVVEYYYLLRTVLQEHPEYRRSLTCCKNCGIYFLTDPRNRGRRGLYCPFGCRDSRKRQNSIQRSKEYYSTPEGKGKKKVLNRRRSGKSKKISEDFVPDDASPLVTYLCFLIGFLERRRVSRNDVVVLIEEVRQHSIAEFDSYAYFDKRGSAHPS